VKPPAGLLVAGALTFALTFALVACSPSEQSSNGLKPVVTPPRTQAPYNIIPVPLDNLRDGHVVHVNGYTFVPGETIVLAECAHEVLTDGAKACDASTVVQATVDAHGAFTQAFTVRRAITIGDDRRVIDCGERAWRCNISGRAITDATRSAGSGIAFVPNDRSIGTGTSSSVNPPASGTPGTSGTSP